MSDSKCPKCGFGEGWISYRWIKSHESECWHFASQRDETAPTTALELCPKSEHLHGLCRRCGFYWPEPIRSSSH